MDEPDKRPMTFNDAADVTHSSAFVILDTLLDEGQITRERADYLKKKFKNLHNRVLTIYHRDNVLLKRARRLRAELDEQCKRIQACGAVAHKDDLEIQSLKGKLSEAEKELVAAQDQEGVLQVEVLEYERQKQMIIMEREDAIAEEEARLRPLMEGLRAEIKEMNVEVEELASAHVALTAKREALYAEETGYDAEASTLLAAVEHEKIQLNNMHRDPERATKQAQLVERNLVNAEREIHMLEEKLALQAEAISRKELQCSNLESDHVAAEAALQQLNNDIAVKQKTLATLNTSLEAELESKRDYQERLVELTQLTRAQKLIVQQQEEQLERRQQDRERIEAECQVMDKEREALAKELEGLKEQTRRIVKEEESLEHECRELQREMDSTRTTIESCRAKMMKNKENEEAFRKRVGTVLDDIHNAEEVRVAKERQAEVRHVELMSITLRRQELVTDCARAESQLRVLQDRIDTSKLREAEVKREKQEYVRTLNKLTNDFRRVRRDRVVKAMQVQKLTSKLVEMNTQRDALQSELEHLLNEVAEREKNLLLRKREIHEASQQYAHLNMEHNEQQKRLEKVHMSEVEVRAEMERTNGDLAALREQLRVVAEQHDSAVDSRQQMGIQLLDRNDAIALLDEKIRVQETALREGAAMSHAREEEIRRLNIRLADVNREIENCQRVLPQVRVLESQLAQLQSELDDEQWRVDVLEAELVDPKNAQRWHRLKQVMPGDHAGVDRLAARIATRTQMGGETGGVLDPEIRDGALPLPTARAIGESTLHIPTSQLELASTHPVADANKDRRSTASTDMCVDIHNTNGGGEGTSSMDSSSGGTTNAACVRVEPSDTVGDVLLREAASDVYVQLQSRCHALERQLESVNVQLREKQLVLQEVTELSERMSEQAEAGRDVTRTLGRKVNDHHSGIRQRTRQMMATISELSLFQASSIQLQQEVERLQGMVSEAEERMQDGQTPFAEAEEEYRRMQESNRRYAEMLQRRQKEEAERQQQQQQHASLDSGGYNIGQVGAVAVTVRTTAVRRPNVYVPDDELGLPKPFGRYAPFHPTTTHLTTSRLAEATKTSNRTVRATTTTTRVAANAAASVTTMNSTFGVSHAPIGSAAKNDASSAASQCAAATISTGATATTTNVASTAAGQSSNLSFRGPREQGLPQSSDVMTSNVLSGQQLRYPHRPAPSSSSSGAAPAGSVMTKTSSQARPSSTPPDSSTAGNRMGVADEDALSTTASAVMHQTRLSSRHGGNPSFAASR